MTFDEVLAQVQALLQREKRVSYRGLKRRFALDDEYLEDLKEELIGAKRLAAANKTEERWYEAELYRLKGELTLQQFKVQGSTFNVENPQSAFPNPQLEAEACFRKAIEVARKQQAKSWELRTSTSLARLWQSQGKKTEAHKLLSEVYDWFTEGFDTKDLQEAKALLEELA